MDINEIKINTSTLNKDVLDMDVKNIRLQSEQAELRKLMYELNTMWKGKANSAFEKQYESDCDFLSMVIKEFLQYADEMRNARQEYENCESTVEDIVKAIQI